MGRAPKFQTYVDGKYLITGTFRVREPRIRLVKLTVEAASTEDDTEITASALREVHLTELVHVAKRMVAREAQFWTPEGQREAISSAGGAASPLPLPDEVVKEARRRIRLASAREQRGAARGRGDAFYRRVALDLVELVESGKPTPGGVLETLARIEAERLKLPEVPIQTLRTWLRVARDRHFLAPGERGRLVAIPGARLYATEEGDV